MVGRSHLVFAAVALSVTLAAAPALGEGPSGAGPEFAESFVSPPVPANFAPPVIMGAYFPYGRGIVEGFAYHPGEQDVGNTGDPNSKKLAAIFYGNKFVHTSEGFGPGVNPNALETRTFLNGTLIIPMDDKQADVVLSFGFMHALLRNNTFIYRIIEPPDVTLRTQNVPAGDFFRGGPVLVMPGSAATFMQVHQSFAAVSYDTLRSDFTSNRVFIVGKPTRILLIKGGSDWGHTQDLLNEMKIPFTTVSTGTVDGDPNLLMNYDLAVDDCGGWDTQYGGTLPAATAAKMREFVLKGGEMIYTDRALGELSGAFPGYIATGPYSPTRVLDTTMVNVPEFPGQYYGNSTVKLYQLNSGAEMHPPISKEVRVMAYHSPAGASPTVSLTAPSGGTLNAGSSTTITWTASGGTGALTIDLEFSVSGSAGPWVEIARGIANAGSRAWSVPYAPTSDGLVRVTAWDTQWKTAVGTSAAPFAISAPQLKLDVGASAVDNTLQEGSTTSVTAVVNSANGPVLDADVTFGSSVGGSFNPATGKTDSTGRLRTTFTAPATASQSKGTLSATASKSGWIGGADSLNMFINPAGQAALDVLVMLKPPLLHSGDTAYVEVRVTNGTGPVPGATLAATPTAGIATPTTLTTNATGEAVFAFTLPSTPIPMQVAVVVNASAGGHLDGTGEGVGTLFPMLDMRISATAQKTVLYAGEKSNVAIHVDSNSAVMAGAALQYSLTGQGSISATNGTTNATGDAQVEFTAPGTIPFKQTATLMMSASKPGYSPSSRSVLFSLEPTPDNSPPYIVSTTPANASAGVPVNSNVEVKWNESMDPGSSQGAFSSSPAILCTWSWPSPDLQRCTPRSPLQASTPYDVSVSTSARDVAGNQMKVPYSFGFTTASGGGGTAPAVTTTTPSNGATGVPVTTAVSFTFSMPMNTSATQGAFSIAPVTPGAWAWTSSDQVLTLTPGASLLNGTSYTATLSTSAKSAAGVALPGSYRLTFTTQTGGGVDPIPPAVRATTPTGGSTGVARSTNIVIDFDREMDTVSAQSAITSTPAAPGTFLWTSGITRLTLYPTADLAGDTDYEFVVAKSAKSKAGVAMVADFKFSFRTEKVPDTKPPVIVHAPVTKVIAGRDIAIQAEVTDDHAVTTVTLRYRAEFASGWNPVVMAPVTGAVYRASIPGASAVAGVIEYYLEAQDSAANQALEPASGASMPLRILVEVDPAGNGGTPSAGIPLLYIAAVIAGVVLASVALALLARRRRRTEREAAAPAPQPHEWSNAAADPAWPPDDGWQR